MADQTIAPQVLTTDVFKEIAANKWADLTAANDGVVEIVADHKYVILAIDAAGGAVLTITHGDGVLAGRDDIASAVMTVALMNAIVFQSSRCKWLAGSDAGKVRIKTTANLKVACIQLP